MAQLLVSVRNSTEAIAAVSGGADIIDVKEPVRGALGRASDAVVASVITEAAGRPVSVALGELTDWTDSAGATLPPLDGVRFAKVGLADCAGGNNWVRLWRVLSERIDNATRGHTQLVATAYADHERAETPPVETVLDMATDARCAVFMIDTWRKDGRGLLHCLRLETLKNLATRCAMHGLELALAGSLEADDMSRLRPVTPSILAVRGAACRSNQRESSVEEISVRRLARLAHAMQASDSTPPTALVES